MEGEDVKKMLVSNGIDLNAYKYFDNKTKYEINDIPKIVVERDKFLQKLCKKYGENVGKYIITKMYPYSDLSIEPINIIEMIKK